MEGAINPSFPLSLADAKRALKTMAADTKRLARPLVLLAGYLDPHASVMVLRRRLGRLTGDDRILGASFVACTSFDMCRDRVIRAVDKRFPCRDPRWTTEVDVCGVSMGGLVARCAAAVSRRDASARRLRIARLFTISTPHRGAVRAEAAGVTQLQRDMRPGSAFLKRLEDSEREGAYPIYPYVRLHDRVAGAANAAPRGRAAWWVPNRPLQPPHVGAALDARILADIARRLRGEPPFTTEPPAPLP